MKIASANVNFFVILIIIFNVLLFSTNSKKLIKVIDKSEAELNNFLSDNWNDFFPQYTFTKNEFTLDGNVRSKGTSGRIDILTFNPKSKKFIVFEFSNQ